MENELSTDVSKLPNIFDEDKTLLVGYGYSPLEADDLLEEMATGDNEDRDDDEPEVIKDEPLPTVVEEDENYKEKVMGTDIDLSDTKRENDQEMLSKYDKRSIHYGLGKNEHNAGKKDKPAK